MHEKVVSGKKMSKSENIIHILTNFENPSLIGLSISSSYAFLVFSILTDTKLRTILKYQCYAKQPPGVTNPKVVPKSVLAFPANVTFSSLLLHRQVKINIKQHQQRQDRFFIIKVHRFLSNLSNKIPRQGTSFSLNVIPTEE